MFASVVPSKSASQYHVEHVRFPAENVAVAYVRRLSVRHAVTPDPRQPGSFDELALLVLVRRDVDWWLAAGQHVPDRRDMYAQPGKTDEQWYEVRNGKVVLMFL